MFSLRRSAALDIPRLEDWEDRDRSALCEGEKRSDMGGTGEVGWVS